MKSISYKKGYKYQLSEPYSVEISIKPEGDIISPSGFITLSLSGVLTIKKHYAWDGPSGPTLDTLNFMRPSLVHDALYQLMREGLLDNDENRKLADRLLYIMCKEDGMGVIRAWLIYRVLRLAGKSSSKANNIKTVINAPE